MYKVSRDNQDEKARQARCVHNIAKISLGSAGCGEGRDEPGNGLYDSLSAGLNALDITCAKAKVIVRTISFVFLEKGMRTAR